MTFPSNGGPGVALSDHYIPWMQILGFGLRRFGVWSSQAAKRMLWWRKKRRRPALTWLDKRARIKVSITSLASASLKATNRCTNGRQCVPWDWLASIPGCNRPLAQQVSWVGSSSPNSDPSFGQALSERGRERWWRTWWLDSDPLRSDSAWKDKSKQWGQTWLKLWSFKLNAGRFDHVNWRKTGSKIKTTLGFILMASQCLAIVKITEGGKKSGENEWTKEYFFIIFFLNNSISTNNCWQSLWQLPWPYFSLSDSPPHPSKVVWGQLPVHKRITELKAQTCMV